MIATWFSAFYRLILGLLERFHSALAARKLPLGSGIEVGPELREGLDLAVLREVEPEAAGHLAHGLDLSVAANPRNTDANVHSRAHTRVEQVGLEVYLPVCDRNHVGGDVRGDVAPLGLDDRQRGERSTTLVVGEFGRTLQQA